MKTDNLKKFKDECEEVENNTEQRDQAKLELSQFNQIKNILFNLSFNHKGHKTLQVDIIEIILDELRRERKIRMVLEDAEIEHYIKLDLSGLTDDMPGLDEFVRAKLIEKQIFKEKMLEKISIIKLGYNLEVLKRVH